MYGARDAFFARSRSRPSLVGAGVRGPESAPGPRTSGAGADQKRSRLRNNEIRIRNKLMLIYSPDQDDMEKSMNSSYSSNRPGAK